MMNENIQTPLVHGARPQNFYDALMQTKPHEEPLESLEDLMLLQEAIGKHLDRLTPRERWIVNGCISEMKSLQTIADELGFTKTHVWRLRNQAFDKLRRAMEADTTITKKIKLSQTWEQSAMKWVNHIAHDYIMPKYNRHDDMMRVIRDEIVHYHFYDDTSGMEEAFKELASIAVSELRAREIWDTGFMTSLLCRKQHDYGPTNVNLFGLYGVIVRLSDKIERLANLRNRKAVNESIDDTLMDVVGYCVVALMCLDQTFQLPLGDDYDPTAEH